MCICRGFLGKNGTWQIPAKVYYNKKTCDAQFYFLIDTGSVKTIVSPSVAQHIGIDLNILKKYNGVITGVGTNGKKNSKSALVLPNSGLEFIEETSYGELVPLLQTCDDGILIGDPETWDVESLIGLDILNRFNLFPDVENKRIKLERI
jgi:hypothetical protein